MRTIVAVCLIGTLGAASAGAADIQGKWGLGAGVSSGGLQVSLIRGKSERSAWLFDVSISQTDFSRDTQVSSNPQPFNQDQDIWTLQVGPGYRRFLRPDAKFSPYWDVEVAGLYSKSHLDLSQASFALTATQTSAGVAGTFSLGLEYFFRPHLSVAAHGSVADVTWRHTSRSQSDAGVVFSHFSTTGHDVTSSIGFNPVIFVRGYW